MGLSAVSLRTHSALSAADVHIPSKMKVSAKVGKCAVQHRKRKVRVEVCLNNISRPRHKWRSLPETTCSPLAIHRAIHRINKCNVLIISWQQTQQLGILQVI